MADPVEELNHIYSSTFLRHKKTGHVVYISAFRYGDTRNEILINLYDYTDKVELPRIAFNKDDYDWSFPQLGNINEQTCASCLSRVPLRQYKRTIAASNIRRDIIGASAIEAVGKRVPNTRSNTAEMATAIIAAFNPSYFQYKEALELVTKGQRFSAAFSRNLSIGVDPRIDTPALFYRTILIGTADSGVITLAKPAVHLKEQIQVVLPEVTINGQ